MVGSINAPATGNTLDLYAANSKKTKSSEVPPGGPHGGTFVPVSDSGSSGTGSSSVAGGSSGGSTAVSSVAGSASTPAYNGGGGGGGGSGSSPTTVASGTVSGSSTATSTGPAQQTKNAAASLGAYGWRELFGLVAAAGGVAAYMV